MSFAIRPLDPRDDRRGFTSGSVELDRFFHRYAGQNQFRHHLGVTYVAVDGTRILGFVTVSPSEVEIENLPAPRRRRLPRYPLPVLRLARLAVSENARGRGVGQALLRFSLLLARQMAEAIGCVGVVVDSKADAVSFYRRYGFEPMLLLEGGLLDRPEPTTMFLPLSTIPGS